MLVITDILLLSPPKTIEFFIDVFSPSVIGMYCMERVGIRHDVKSEILEFMQSSFSYKPRDYIGWDPFVGPPGTYFYLQKLYALLTI
jgi:hypothetical protein